MRATDPKTAGEGGDDVSGDATRNRVHHQTVGCSDGPCHPEQSFDPDDLLRQLGWDSDVLAEFETTLRLGPRLARPYYIRGVIRQGRGDIDGALADFDHVRKLDPTFVSLYINRARLLADIGRPDAAEDDAVAGLRLAPDNPHLHVVLGQVYAERADYHAAFAAFDQALTLDPDLVEALSGRAATAWRVDDCEGALVDFQRAVQLAPDDPAPRFGRALVLQETGRWAEALADLDAAAFLAPEHTIQDARARSPHGC
jgi:tetratricopeptide (TPR) repeat protein